MDQGARNVLNQNSSRFIQLSESVYMFRNNARGIVRLNFKVAADPVQNRTMYYIRARSINYCPIFFKALG
ncbi:hypothetical protein WG66_014124 [Moniliophthora roreri]|nr:hypothetical protein WG66_014124 [Moniliophthora roreri]